MAWDDELVMDDYAVVDDQVIPTGRCAPQRSTTLRYTIAAVSRRSRARTRPIIQPCVPHAAAYVRGTEDPGEKDARVMTSRSLLLSCSRRGSGSHRSGGLTYSQRSTATNRMLCSES